MPTSKKLRVEVDLDKLKQLHLEGFSNKDIAERLGCSQEVVGHRMNMLGLRSSFGARLDVSKERVAELHAQGLTNRSIANALGVAPNVIARRLGELGLKTNGRVRMKRIINGDQAQCTRCSEWFPADSFPKGRSGRSDEYFLSFCWACKRKVDVARRNKNIHEYLNEVHRRMKARAKKKSHPVTIDREYLYRLYDLQEGRCALTDVGLVCRHGEGHVNRPANLSVDRIRSDQGYIPGNVILITHRVNTIKSDITLDEMREWMPGWYARLVPLMERIQKEL